MARDQVVYSKIAKAKSFLFVPANRPERITNAMGSRADFVIADLEDAVSPAEKEGARQALMAWLDENPTVQILVRVNSVGTFWHSQDLMACRHPQIAGVVLPKADTVKSIVDTHLFTGKWVLPIIETPLGVQDIGELAKALGVSRLLFGKLDLAVELNLTPDEGDPEELVFLPYRAMMVTASALAGLPSPVDGVFTAINDAEALTQYTARAKKHGFSALLLIHPKQVDVVLAVFSPSSTELEWAKRVLEAVEVSGGGVVSLDGRMIDAPVIARARRILENVA